LTAAIQPGGATGVPPPAHVRAAMSRFPGFVVCGHETVGRAVPGPWLTACWTSVAVAVDGSTVNAVLEVADPPGVVTVSGPVVAVAGTVAMSVESSTTENAACVSLNTTENVPVRFVPSIVMLSPDVPEPGVNPVTVGAGVVIPFGIGNGVAVDAAPRRGRTWRSFSSPASRLLCE